jgi:alanyl aminopeptidase
LELRIDPREKQFSGTVVINLQAEEVVNSIWLHGKDLNVTEVWVVDASEEHTAGTYEQKHESGVSLISLNEAVGPGPLDLHVAWSAEFNDLPNGLFRVERGENAYAATQFQPISARKVFPGFDEPGFKVPFDISLITPTGQVAITNTPERSAQDLGDGNTRREFETSRPLPTYLLAFAVGPYDLVDYGVIPPNDIRDRDVPLRAIAAKGQGKNLKYALEHTPGILTALEEFFGTPYPYRKLDLIAVPTSFGGAMENAGAITYDEYLLLMDESAAIDQRRAYTAVHAHELGHMWFGDLVTPKWWNDIWLNESFATWIMYKAAGEYWPEGEFARRTQVGALGAMTNDSLAAARQIREPVDHNDSISDAFDGITYQKGGGVLAMLERYTGEDEFRDGIRLHLERHADGVADAEEFIASVAEGSGKAEIEAAFKSYIEQPGVPLLDVQVDCESGQSPTLVVSQARYAPLGSSIDPQGSQWLVPMCVSYQDGGADKSECIMLRERQQTFPLQSDQCPSMLNPNAGGAGYYRFNMNETWWQGLIAGIPSMQPADALVASDSLDAAFRAGTVTAATYLAGMNALINSEAWDVVESALDQLEAIIEIIEYDQLGPVNAALSSIATPRLERLAGQTGDAADLLNARLQRFLMVVARDEALRAPVAEQAARRIGMKGEPDTAAVPQSELETVLSVGVQDLGRPFFDALMEQALASEDRAFRGDAFGALARAEDPALVADLQKLILSGQMQGYEPIFMLFRQMARPATTELTYDWFLENFDAVIAMMPDSFRSRLPAFGSSFCSNKRADEWASFVESHADRLPGYERSLAQADETVRLCAALREAKAAELFAALTGS